MTINKKNKERHGKETKETDVLVQEDVVISSEDDESSEVVSTLDNPNQGGFGGLSQQESSSNSDNSVVSNAILFNKIGREDGMRGQTSVLSEEDKKALEYKNVELLRRFISAGGRLLGRRFTGLTSDEQRRVAKLVKEARMLALLPFVKE